MRCAISTTLMLLTTLSALQPAALAEAADPPAERAIVVFGARVEADGAPSPRLRERLDRALELARQDPAATLVVTGGTRTARAEGPLMKRWLVDRGIPGSRILVEPRARHTGENADLSVPLVSSTGAGRVTAVTSRDHLPRAMFHLRWAMRNQGLGRVRLDGVGAGARPTLRARLREAGKLVRDLGFRLRDRWRGQPVPKARALH